MVVHLALILACAVDASGPAPAGTPAARAAAGLGEVAASADALARELEAVVVLTDRLRDPTEDAAARLRELDAHLERIETLHQQVQGGSAAALGHLAAPGE